MYFSLLPFCNCLLLKLATSVVVLVNCHGTSNSRLFKSGSLRPVLQLLSVAWFVGTNYTAVILNKGKKITCMETCFLILILLFKFKNYHFNGKLARTQPK